MPLIHLFVRAAVMTLLVLCASAFHFANAAEDVAATAARARLERIQALRKERPGDGLLLFYEAITRINLGERAMAFELLRSLKGRRLGLIPVRDLGFEPVWDEPEFRKIRDELAADEPQTPDAPVAFRLSDPKLIPEGIAFDPASRRFFIGSVAQHKIVVTDGKKEPRDFSSPSDKLDAVLGLTVDADRGFLYAVSTNGFEESAKEERRNLVLRYSLQDGRLLDRFPAPDAMQLNDLAFAPDGSLFATDSMGGSLFRMKPNETTLTRFGAAGTFRGANGIAFGFEARLYVAIVTGIVQVNKDTGEPTRVEQPDSIVTGGIDGLYRYKGDLIGIQNSTNPGRVIRLTTENPKGTRMARLTVLQSHHHPEFHEPTTGAIAEGKLYLIANSYVGHYQPDGTINDVADLKPTAIIAVPLSQSGAPADDKK